MKILVAAVAFSSEMSGVQRHAFNVVRCALLRPEITEVHLVAAPWQRRLVGQANFEAHPRFKAHFAEMGGGSVSRNRWYYLGLPAMAKRLAVDVVHLAYPVPVNRRRFACPVVLTLHDLYPYDIPMNFGFPQLIFNRLILRQCLREVHSIACVSDATRARLEQHAPTKVWERSIRIYNCVEPGPPPSPEPPLAEWRDEPFLLCVAQHRRNKNLLLLIRAFHELLKRGVVEANTRLVIVGIAGPETQDVRDLIRQSGLSGAVALMEGVSEAGLQWLYKHCRCLVAPSSTEGFGLSIAEGLLAGCRVVCSDILAFREVGGSRCHFFRLDGDHPAPLIHAVASALHSERPGQLELPHFSSGMLAGQYLDFYRSAIESQKAASRWLRGEMAVPVRGAQ